MPDETRPGSLWNYLRIVVAAISVTASTVLATSLAWLSPDTEGLLLQVLRYIAARFLPEAVLLLILGLMLLIPLRIYASAAGKVRAFFVVEYRTIAWGQGNRLRSVSVAACWLLVIASIAVGLVALAPRGWDLARARASLLLKWGKQDFLAYSLTDINRRLTSLQLAKAQSEFTALKSAVVGSPALREADVVFEKLRRIHEFGVVLANQARDLEVKGGPNRRSLSLYAHAYMLLPEDDTVRMRLGEYERRGAAARAVISKVSTMCAAPAAAMPPAELTKSLDYLIDGDATRAAYAALFDAGAADARATNLYTVCEYHLKAGGIFDSTMTRADFLAVLGKQRKDSEPAVDESE